MSPETQESIFDPFFTTKSDGHGLGMSAVIGIIRGHNGFIMIDSHIGQGTSFQVCFPICEKDICATTNDNRPEKQLNGVVLLVDDDSDILESTTYMLQEHGLEVITAVDGLDALEKFKKQHDTIKMIILDLSMPRMGGIECMGKMRNIDGDCNIILTSGYHESEIRLQHSNLSQIRFLQKPYLPDKLIDSIQLQ